MYDNIFDSLRYLAVGAGSYELRTGLYMVWSLGSIVVFYLAARVVLFRAKTEQYGPVFWLSLGIALHWLADVLGRVWFMVSGELRRNGIDSSWMSTSPVLILIVSVTLISATIHVRSLAGEFKNFWTACWLFSAPVIFAFGWNLKWFYNLFI